jgi:hypothetical protein
MNNLILLLLCFFTGPKFANAQIFGPSVTEIQFSYTTTFVTSRIPAERAQDIAQFHASHMFGIFQSPELISQFGLRPQMAGGIGAPRMPMGIRILSTHRIGSGKTQIQYYNQGKIILHKIVAARLLTLGRLDIPLPSDPDEIYHKKCTDDHYFTFGDYWYFYDPFRPGCEKLGQAPLAISTTMKISLATKRKMDLSPRLDLLRGNNGNGDLISIYVIHGYADSSTDPRDEGRLNFESFNSFLRAQRFEESTKQEGTTRPLHIFRRPVKLPSGLVANVEVRHLLVEAEIDSRNVSFAKFFKDAVANADVIVYEGHSGLGGNLDIASLEQKAGRFVFPTRKRQIFFFDSCSSYSYYLEAFAAEKTRASIDVITYGLPSYFDSHQTVLKKFITTLLTEPDRVTWSEILSTMEKPLRGGSYLLNVGGI